MKSAKIGGALGYRGCQTPQSVRLPLLGHVFETQEHDFQKKFYPRKSVAHVKT